jgi:hypothetical protein
VYGANLCFQLITKTAHVNERPDVSELSFRNPVHGEVIDFDALASGGDTCKFALVGTLQGDSGGESVILLNDVLNSEMDIRKGVQ